jgi:hypothetical protein
MTKGGAGSKARVRARPQPKDTTGAGGDALLEA